MSMYPDAPKPRFPMPPPEPRGGEGFVSACCKGETCMCGRPAIRKIGEEIFFDDPNPVRHNLTAYVCAEHFAMLLGPAAARSVGVAPSSPPSGGGVLLEALFEHREPEDDDWVVGMSPKEVADLTAEGWASQIDTLMQDADILDREGKPGTGGRVRFAAKFIRAALALRDHPMKGPEE